jgi:hypothetical protein
MGSLYPGLRLLAGRLTLLAPLGRGGSGEVWRALDARGGRPREVAVKVLPAADGGAEALARESEIAVRVPHAGIIRTHDGGVDDGWALLVMERCSGSLGDVVDAVGPLAPADAVVVICEAAAALAAAHRAAVVHRDIKPHNLLLRPSGEVVVSDFGSARVLMAGHHRTTASALLGSLPYMAPEQRADPRSATPASDVYALGMTLAWLCLGRTLLDPFVPDGAARARAALPAAVCGPVLACCAWDPADRPPDAQALLPLLTAAAAALPAPAASREGWLGPAEPLSAPPTPAPPARPGAYPGAARRSPRLPWSAFAPWLASVSALAAAASSGWLALRVGPTVGAAPAAAEEERAPPCAGPQRRWYQQSRIGPEEAGRALVADADGDGRVDVLFPHLLGEVIRTYWGDGQPTLGAYSDLPGGRTDRPPAVGDVDGDGRPDLVLALRDAGSFRLYRGQGDRRFGPAEDIFQGPAPFELQLVDVDSDGALDLVFRDALQADLLWRRGDGRGGFAPHQVLWSSETAALQGLLWAGRTAAGGAVAVWLKDEIRTLHVRGDAVVSGATRVATLAPAPPIPWVRAGAVVAWYQSFEDRLYERLADAEGWCLAGRVGEAFAAGDLDQDGVPELFWSRSCSGCTSNHLILRTGGS